MHRLQVWSSKSWKSGIKQVFAVLMVLGLLVAPMFTDLAQADEQGFFTAAQTFLQTVNRANATFNDFSHTAQDYLDQSMGDVRQLLQELPGNLEQLGLESDPAVQDKLRQKLTAKQNQLNSIVKSFDDWATKADQANKSYDTTLEAARTELKKSFDLAENDFKSLVDQKTANWKTTLKQTANVIADLSSDTNRVLNGKTAFLPSKFDERITALNDALNGAADTVTGLVNTVTK
jgi:DNA anti-recombination protein RmuC